MRLIVLSIFSLPQFYNMNILIKYYFSPINPYIITRGANFVWHFFSLKDKRVKVTETPDESRALWSNTGEIK